MTGNETDRVAYCEAWAKMMVDIWIEKAKALGIHDGDFMESFMYDVRETSRGDIDKIVHVYNYYGRMVDMGVGNGVSFENRESSKRKEKEWYGNVYWRSIKVLTEKMAEMYGQSFLSLISENMYSSEARTRY